MDGGAYCTLSPVVLSRGTLHAGGPYRCPNVRIHSRVTATNTPPNGAFRGFGAPQVEFALEVHLSRIAAQLGISPVEIRRRNVYSQGDTTPFGQVLRESVAGREVLERAVEEALREQAFAQRVGANCAGGGRRGWNGKFGAPAGRARDRSRPGLAWRRVHRLR